MRRILTVCVICSLAVLIPACTEMPTVLEAGRPSMDNGGSYGSGGRVPDSDAETASGATLVSASRVTVLCNGGSYGSGGRSETCGEDGS